MKADGWEIISSETHFRSAHLEVATVELRTPARRAPRPWMIVHRKCAVVIAPMTADGKLILIQQERIPIRSAIWELPAGQIDEPPNVETNAIEQVALRELREETGYELAPAGKLIALGDYFSSPGFTDERGYLFLARPVQGHANGQAHDESESILDCRAFSAAEVSRMIDRNQIRDANALSACARLVARGLLSLDCS